MYILNEYNNTFCPFPSLIPVAFLEGNARSREEGNGIASSVDNTLTRRRAEEVPFSPSSSDNSNSDDSVNSAAINFRCTGRVAHAVRKCATTLA